MREWTLKGYLLSQMQMLAEYDGESLYKFAAMATSDARLKDVLCMYLVLYVEGPLKTKLLKKYTALATACHTLEGLSVENAVTFLDGTDFIGYRTVYDNFLYMRDRQTKEDNLKRMMHQKIVERQREKRLSNYRIYTHLKLNPGNINAFLKSGDVSKVSLQTTRRILMYVNEHTDHPHI